MPWCGADLQSVINDINLMSQLTNRIRLYGMDCDQANLTFQAIKLLKVPMEVVLTVWVDNNQTTYERQRDTLYKVLDEHGTDMLTGVSVGNEVLFRKDMDLATLGGLMNVSLLSNLFLLQFRCGQLERVCFFAKLMELLTLLSSLLVLYSFVDCPL